MVECKEFMSAGARCDDPLRGEDAAEVPCRPRAKPNRETLRSSSNGAKGDPELGEDDKDGLPSALSENGLKDPM